VTTQPFKTIAETLFVYISRRAEGFVAFVVLLAFTMTLQVLAGAYTSNFGTSSTGNLDEPAHLVTSLMARDFIASLDFRHAWQFVQEYYYHYPKVAIGHWPPVLYGALGTWFLIFEASRTTSMIFIAIVATITACVIYFIGKRLIARWAGALSAILFLASPLVQESSARVMPEHLVTLAMLVSTLCFASFARTGQTGHGFAFGVVAVLAILTRGSAWALALVPGLTIALTKRWWLLRKWGLWLAAVPVLFAGVPWYVLTRGMVEDSWYGGSSYWLEAIPYFSRSIYLALGFTVLLFALIGLWSRVIQVRVKRRAEVVPDWAALAALAIATFALHCIVPAGVESRYMVTVVPSIVLFFTAGIDKTAQRLGARLPISVVRAGLIVAVVAAFCGESFTVPLQPRNGGHEELVQHVMARASNAAQIWLISSDADGEGRLIAAVALREGHPDSYVLRAKTILGGGDWLWRNMQDRFDTPAKLAGLLNDIPVTIVVIDDQIPPEAHRPYQDRLRDLVAREDDKWELIGSYPQTRGEMVFPNSLHVYARRPAASVTMAPSAIWLDRLRALMVRKELR
jgi:4-amino-4-deoxy-L-arabinose transferase-like glycosyltransferase